MSGYLCQECKWVGTEPERHTSRGGDGEAYRVVNESCPDCGHDELYAITLCVDCAASGEDREATHDDYCKEHFDENQEGGAEAAHDFKRDQVRPVRAKVRA